MKKLWEPPPKKKKKKKYLHFVTKFPISEFMEISTLDHISYEFDFVLEFDKSCYDKISSIFLKTCPNYKNSL